MDASSIAEMDIISMLAAVFEGKIPEDPGPSQKIKPGEKQRGIVTSSISRRLFAANMILASHIKSLEDEHKVLHQKDGGSKSKPVDHDCEAFQEKTFRLSVCGEIIRGLFWQSIVEKHPHVADKGATLKRGWLLVDSGDECNDIVLVPDKSALANNFIDRLAEIVCGKRSDVDEEGLDPVAPGEEILGLLDDKRIQTLWSMSSQIEREKLRQLPFDTVFPIVYMVEGVVPLSELKRFCMLAMYYEMLMELVISIFCQGVFDAVPTAAVLSGIDVRRGWKVVKRVPDEMGEIPGRVITSAGPLIATLVPISGSGS